MSSRAQNQKNNFTVEIGKSIDGPFVHYIKLDPTQDDEHESHKAADGASETSEITDDLNFQGLLTSWAQSCLGFLDAFPLFSNVAHFVQHHTSGEQFIEFLETNALKKVSISKEHDNDHHDYAVYTLGREHLDYAYRKIKKRRQFESAEQALSKAQLLAIIAEYEAFMADLLRIAIRITPESFISSSQTVNASTIIRGENIDQLRNTIIEDYISDLQRQSHIEVIKTALRQLKLAEPDEKSLREFGEICLRRNTLTHANGVANRIYRTEMKKLGFSESEIPGEGEKLIVDDHYMRRSIARIFLMGYFVGHLVWQHLQKESHEDSVTLIINHSHDFLVGGYTKICGRLCEFGLNPKSPARESERAYLIINEALSFSLNDKLAAEERSLGVKRALARRDWSIVDTRFKMALCCLNERYDEFGELFDLVKDRDFEINDFMSLAIFKKARLQPVFKEKMKEHYGIEITTGDEPMGLDKASADPRDGAAEF